MFYHFPRRCGSGPDFCGDGCLSTCNATAQCGTYGATPGAGCPLNVCCSEYGFCGTTEEFCGAGCQKIGNTCDPVKTPSCPSSRTADGLERKIAYYELFGLDRPCSDP